MPTRAKKRADTRTAEKATQTKQREQDDHALKARLWDRWQRLQLHKVLLDFRPDGYHEKMGPHHLLSQTAEFEGFMADIPVGDLIVSMHQRYPCELGVEVLREAHVRDDSKTLGELTGEQREVLREAIERRLA